MQRRLGGKSGRRVEQAVAQCHLGHLRTAEAYARKHLIVGHVLGGERRKRDDEGVAIKTRVGVWPNQFAFNSTPTRDGRLGPGELLHGQLRRHPRSAATRPAGAVVHADVDAEPVTLLDSMRHQRAPMGVQISRWTGREVVAAVKHHHAAHPDAVHGLEIESDALARDVAVHPQPEGARTGFGRRRGETCGQRVRNKVGRE